MSFSVCELLVVMSHGLLALRPASCEGSWWPCGALASQEHVVICLHRQRTGCPQAY